MILNDIGLDQAYCEKIGEQINRDVVFFDADNMTSELMSAKPNIEEDGQLIVFPLNGAIQVSKRLSLSDEVPQAFVNVKRDPSNLVSGRYILDGEELLDIVSDYKPEQIKIIDDVVAKGFTVQEIRKFTESAFGRTYLWSIACWMMAYPAKSTKSESGVDGFDNLETSILYYGENGKRVPLNSLSTWVYSSDKRETVLDSYAEKYTNQKDEFIKLIENIRGLK